LYIAIKKIYGEPVSKSTIQNKDELVKAISDLSSKINFEEEVKEKIEVDNQKVQDKEKPEKPEKKEDNNIKIKNEQNKENNKKVDSSDNLKKVKNSNKEKVDEMKVKGCLRVLLIIFLQSFLCKRFWK
jgi:hypothetical protein